MKSPTEGSTNRAAAMIVTMVVAAVLVIAVPAAARAQSVADFYQGKRVTLTIGSSNGGGTDLYGRLVAAFIGRHIPGHPQVVASNVPGANGLVSVNQLYNAAAKDGTAFGTFGRYVVYEALWKNKAARFVPDRLNWIGNVNLDVSTCVTWHTTGVTTLADFMTRDLKMGATTQTHVNILDRVFGARLRPVKGYPGGNDVTIALERGEVDGRCNWSWSSIVATRPNWLRDKKINIVLQFARQRLPELDDVPLASDLATTDAQRQILDLVLSTQQMARVFAAPPDVPPERVAALRAAFDATMTDSDFLSAASRLNLSVAPVSGAEVQKQVAALARMSPAVVKTFHDAVVGTP